MWALAIFKVTSLQSESDALRWQYVLDVAAIYIPVFYFYFISELLARRNIRTRVILFIASTLFALFSFTPLFKRGLSSALGFFWIEPGSLYLLFPVFFVTVLLVAYGMLYRAFLKEKENEALRQQLKYQLIAGLVGFGGGITNFLPQYFDVFPFGNYFITLYVAFIGYGIVHNRLFNIKTVASELFAGGNVLLFLFIFLSSNTLTEWILRFLFFILVTVFSIFLVRGVYTEVSQRKRIEKMAADLEVANEWLKELDQLKSEFVSLATHQIRGPITAIKGYASMLLEGDYGSVPDVCKEPVETILQSSSALAGIVQDFLDISRIEQGKMKYEFTDVDVGALTEEIAKELRPNVEKKGLLFTLEIEKGLHVTADQGKLRQVIANLIDNSTKYTPSGKVTIRVKGEGGNARIEIADTGVGIAPETLPKLFQKFSRSEDASKANLLGTGLGLYVARQFVEAQKGKVWAESAGSGKGSTFVVSLPSAGPISKKGLVAERDEA
jgi:signal transduction histidine kinase